MRDRLAITRSLEQTLYQSKVKPRQRGFTLIEVLVVIIILGVLIGTVSLSIAPQAQRRYEKEVQGLRQLFIFAEENARQTGQALRWVSQGQAPTQYQFLRREVSTSGVVSWVEVGVGKLGDVLRQRKYEAPPQKISTRTFVSNANAESSASASSASAPVPQNASSQSIDLMFSTEETNSPTQIVFEYSEERIVMIIDGLGDYRIVHEKNAP